MGTRSAIVFLCLQDCLIFGIGVCGPSEKTVKDGWQHNVRCIVDTREDSLFIFTSNAKNKDEVNNIYQCIFESHGGKRLKLKKN